MSPVSNIQRSCGLEAATLRQSTARTFLHINSPLLPSSRFPLHPSSPINHFVVDLAIFHPSLPPPFVFRSFTLRNHTWLHRPTYDVCCNNPLTPAHENYSSARTRAVGLAQELNPFAHCHRHDVIHCDANRKQTSKYLCCFSSLMLRLLRCI